MHIARLLVRSPAPTACLILLPRHTIHITRGVRIGNRGPRFRANP
jgi:hypothetical protein